MKNVRIIILMAAVMVGAATADFVLWEDDYLNVTTPHNQGFLFDFSIADIQTGGSVVSVYLNDYAQLNIVGGDVYGDFRAYNNSQVTISSGSVGDDLSAYDNSQVMMSGGSIENNLWAYHGSQVTISDGSVNSLCAYSQVMMSNGLVDSLSVHGTGEIIISGGIVNSLMADQDSQVMMTGGCAASSLSVRDNSIITLRGNNFRVADGASLEGNEIIGTGSLIGRWLDGTSFIVTIVDNHVTATILIIDEPYCTDPIAGDLNNDCHVDLADFAIMAENWLTCNLEPPSACWE